MGAEETDTTAPPPPEQPAMERCGLSHPRARGGGAGPVSRLPPHLKDAELPWGWGAHTNLCSASHAGATQAAVRFPSPAGPALLGVGLEVEEQSGGR